MREPRVLAFSGDWHGSSYWACDTIKTAREVHDVDTIVHVGDYGYTFEKPYRLKVEKACAENDVMLYFVDGNHDDLAWILNKKQDEDGLHIISDHVRYIPRGHRWTWWGKTFIGIGGAVSVDKSYRREGISWWTTETVTYADYTKAVVDGEADVWVSHDVPMGIPIPGIFLGDYSSWPEQEIRDAEIHRQLLKSIYDVVKPKLIVHGHYHTRYNTQFFDTGVVGLAEDGTSFNKNVWVVKSVDDLTPEIV